MVNVLKNCFSRKNINKYYDVFCHFVRDKMLKLKNLVETNYQLGLHHLRLHNVFDAELRFRIVLYLKPDHIGALYNLAKCYFIKDKNEKARTYLNKALKLNPNHPEAKYLLGVIVDKKSVKLIPLSIIEDYFNDYAHKYDIDFNIAQGCKVSADLVDLLKNYLTKEQCYSVLDFGCGTGQCGSQFVKVFPTLELYGLDISRNMLQEAAKHVVNDVSIYKLLIHQDYNEFLLKTKSTYDVILAGLSLHYQMSFSAILQHMAAIVSTHGHIAFVVEKSDEDTLEASLNGNFENFYYNEDYVKHEIKKAGLKLLKIEQSAIKNDRVGLVCICTKQ